VAEEIVELRSSSMSDCKRRYMYVIDFTSVAKIWRNLMMSEKKHLVFFTKLLTNLSFWHNNRLSTPEVSRCTSIYVLTYEISDFHRDWY
jgi:hypothetical protein